MSRNRALLVKIIVSSDGQSRDQIIRATNNQSPVEVSALHATDKIQRDIEDILERHNWYYERRRNYYRNIGKPQMRFVTPLYLASAVVSLILKNVSQATRLKSKFMRTQAGYDSVFSAKLPIDVWPVLVAVFKSVDAGLASISFGRKRGERFARNWRPIVAFLTVSRRFKSFSYSMGQLLQLENKGEIAKTEVDDIWRFITQVDSKYDWNKKIKPTFIQTCCEEAAKTFGLSGIQEVGRRSVKSAPPKVMPTVLMTAEFLDQVNQLLPTQPWKRGVHIEVANKLGCKSSDVNLAINQLISEGKRNQQQDGVVYDSWGNVLAVDPDRNPNDEIQET